MQYPTEKLKLNLLCEILKTEITTKKEFKPPKLKLSHFVSLD